MNGNNVIGRYNAADNGRLYLENRQGLLAGHWVEDSSDKECGRAYQGSRHWGKVQLRPTGNGDRYVGTWGYCDNAGTFALSIIKQGAAQAGIQDKAQPEATFAKPASGEDIRQAEIDATMEKVKAALAADAKKPTVSKPDDGTKVIYQDTGRKISRRPDGTKIIEMEDGERIITKPDGSIEKGRWK